MLGWFGPRCPLDTGEKMWVEFRMRWLAGALGLDRMLRAEVVLPEPRFFPDPYARTPDDARRIFGRVCGFLGLDPARFRLVLRPGPMADAAGYYVEGDRPRIVLAESLLDEPERLVAVMAHELAHDILLAGGLLDGSEEDMEEVTDLLPVALGLGIFAANSPVRDRSTTFQNLHTFRIDRQGYLPSRMIGYALALFAHVRGETRPSWARHLRPDAGRPFEGGLRYLLRTGDSLFRPDAALPPAAPPTADEAVERLSTGTATVRAMTLCEVADLDPPPPALLGPVRRRLEDRDVDVRIEAARALARFGPAAVDAAEDLIWCLGSNSPTLRMYAVDALGAIGAAAPEVVAALTRLLDDPERSVVDRAADGLGRLASLAGSAAPALVDALRLREIACQDSDALADALVAIDPAADVLHRLLAPIDPEVREAMALALRAARVRLAFARQAAEADADRARKPETTRRPLGTGGRSRPPITG